MAEIDQLTRARKRAEDRYLLAKDNLEIAREDSSVLQRAAQEAQDAWNEFKRLDEEFHNHSFMQKLGNLYGI